MIVLSVTYSDIPFHFLPISIIWLSPLSLCLFSTWIDRNISLFAPLSSPSNIVNLYNSHPTLSIFPFVLSFRSLRSFCFSFFPPFPFLELQGSLTFHLHIHDSWLTHKTSYPFLLLPSIPWRKFLVDLITSLSLSLFVCHSISTVPTHDWMNEQERERKKEYCILWLHIQKTTTDTRGGWFKWECRRKGRKIFLDLKLLRKEKEKEDSMSWKGITKRVVCVLQIKWNHFSCSLPFFPTSKTSSRFRICVIVDTSALLSFNNLKRREDERGRKGKREKEWGRWRKERRKLEGSRRQNVSSYYCLSPPHPSSHLCSSFSLFVSSPHLFLSLPSALFFSSTTISTHLSFPFQDGSKCLPKVFLILGLVHHSKCVFWVWVCVSSSQQQKFEFSPLPSLSYFSNRIHRVIVACGNTFQSLMQVEDRTWEE